jgi:hypothetical protein
MSHLGRLKWTRSFTLSGLFKSQKNYSGKDLVVQIAKAMMNFRFNNQDSSPFEELSSLLPAIREIQKALSLPGLENVRRTPPMAIAPSGIDPHDCGGGQQTGFRHQNRPVEIVYLKWRTGLRSDARMRGCLN